VANEQKLDVYVIIAKEERRDTAVAAVQKMRDAGYRVDFPLVPAKVGKQFQNAEQLHAICAILFGDEWPQVKIKDLATREENLVDYEEMLAHLARFPSLSSRGS
jgi:histidyl-tRNA synthetase